MSTCNNHILTAKNVKRIRSLRWTLTASVVVHDKMVELKTATIQVDVMGEGAKVNITLHV